MTLPTGIRSVTSKSMDVLAITAQSHQIFHKGTSPKVGKNPRYKTNHRNRRSCESRGSPSGRCAAGCIVSGWACSSRAALEVGALPVSACRELEVPLPPPIVGVDTRRWGRLLVGPIVSSLSPWYTMQRGLGKSGAIGARSGNIVWRMFICMYIRMDKLMYVSVPIPRKAPAPGLRGLGRYRGVSG